VIKLLKRLDEELKEFIFENKKKENPSKHIKIVKKYLELEGVSLEEKN
jgi:ABC-type uncharacterized transport system substrate-binding protein